MSNSGAQRALGRGARGGASGGSHPATSVTAGAHPTDTWPIELADHGWAMYGGEYVERVDGAAIAGAMYAEHYLPKRQLYGTPIVMIHGGSQTGACFTATPDGRRGWLHDFLRAGYPVYVVDQPERGRSGQSELVYGHSGTLQRMRLESIQNRFTAPACAALWPQAVRHTQWPGTGLTGDPSFDQFYASQAQGLHDRTEIEALNLAALTEMLGAVGPAILLTHSQAGPIGWSMTNARPDLVAGIVAFEPNGPPFYEPMFLGGENWYRYGEELARPWGLTRLPLTFDPPIREPAELEPTLDARLPRPERITGYLQGGQPRRLSRIAGTPIALITGEASYHATYDHATSRFLAQAGVRHEFLRLEDSGLTGNGHMAMLERNNHAIAAVMIEWLSDH